jgi:peroxiredoxin
VIEVSFMQHQRSRYLWIARRDGLPRKLKEVVRVASGEIVAEELWTNVKVDGEIPNTMFSWKPPEGWREWRLPEPESLLLKPGTLAPPFELSGADGARIKLSDLRGKVVWLVFWRIGCPPCYEEIPHLERLHRKYGPRGLVILGFNFADEKERALEFLAERSVTYPSIVDSSDAAQKTCLEHYHVMGVPTHYVIDREGKIADAWGGVNKADEAYAEKRLLRLVKKLGLD